MTTERIAQTFPDINSQGLNTSGTAAGVRSFPDPFVAIASGVAVSIERGTVNLPASTGIGLSQTFTLVTPVDVTTSFIVLRGTNIDDSSTLESQWRIHLSFSGIVGSIASTITIERLTGFVITPSIDVDVFFTVVSFTGAGGTSGDIQVVNCSCVASGASVGCTCTVAGPGAPVGAPAVALTPAQLDLSFCYMRGCKVTQTSGPDARRRPEMWHSDLSLLNSTTGFPLFTPITEIRYSRFAPGSFSCGSIDVEMFGTAVMFF